MLPEAVQALVIPHSMCGLRVPAALTLFAAQMDLSLDCCCLQRGQSCLQHQTATAFALMEHNITWNCSAPKGQRVHCPVKPSSEASPGWLLVCSWKCLSNSPPACFLFTCYHPCATLCLFPLTVHL